MYIQYYCDMKYLPDSIQSIDFPDLLPLMRRGQLFALDTDYSSYGGHAEHRLFATVIRQNGLTQKVLVGKGFTSKEEIWTNVGTALMPENPADHIHYLLSHFPFKAACGVGRYAKLCGIEWMDDLDRFLKAENRCLKCWIYIESQSD